MTHFTEMLMAYALGRRVEYYDMPTIRQDRPGRDGERLSDVVADSRRGEERGVPDGAGRTKAEIGAAQASVQVPSAISRRRHDVSDRKHLSRRTALRGLGATVALPLLDSMIPARSVFAQDRRGRAAGRTRLVCIEQVHGAAGCSEYGMAQNLWNPAATGRSFDLSKGSLAPLEPFRNHLTIVSNTDARMAEAFAPAEVGGDHFRSSAVMYTHVRPKLTEGSDVRVGTSMDQLYVQKFGQDTPIPSMQLSIEPVDQSGGCAYGYACVYTDTISWAAPDQPLPMVRDPRMVFEQLFGAGGTPEQRAARRATDRSILDMLIGPDGRACARSLGAADRQRLDQYANNIREIEQRISRIEARNLSGEARELPGAPAGVPDSFDEHVKLMFDLQVLAFPSDTTRVFSFKFGRDASGRVYPLQRRRRGLPQRVAPRHGRGAHPAVQRDQQVPRLAAAVLPGEAAGARWTATPTCSRRRSSSTARRWRTATAQPPQLPADPARPRRRHRRRRHAREGRRRHADGQRHAHADAQARAERRRDLRRQHGRVLVHGVGETVTETATDSSIDRLPLTDVPCVNVSIVAVASAPRR